MGDNSSMLFGPIRTVALEHWLQGTGRKTLDFNGVTIDDYDSGNFECIWQNDARSIMGEKWHVPRFCSMGEWAGNITGILTDDRYDNLDFALIFGDLKSSRQILFRYYTRFMLVVSELLTDFVVLLHEKGDKSSNPTPLVKVGFLQQTA
jgi:hypothetical protein